MQSLSLRVPRILLSVHVLALSAAMLPGCGQKGPLELPTSAESQGRATVFETLNPRRQRPPSPPPSTAPATPNAAPASSPRQP